MDHHEPASTRHSPNSRWAEQQRSRLHRRRSPQQETRSRNPGLCLVPAAERCETTEVRRTHSASPGPSREPAPQARLSPSLSGSSNFLLLLYFDIVLTIASVFSLLGLQFG
jgi:hypothetical protein